MLSYQNCRLCPRSCGVDRTAGQRGFCQMSDEVKLGAAMLHRWEEPVIATGSGSGALFFSGCTLRCVYCQNAPISHGRQGTAYTTAQLREQMLALIEQGAENINLVTATHFLPSIVPALRPKLPVPVVYNCGGYESVPVLRELDGLIDVYLPDFKYMDAVLAAQLSAAPDYPDRAAEAIREMYRQTGPYVIENGRLRRGVLIRHLILPGQIDNSLRVLEWIADLFKPGQVLLSLMGQYLPVGEQTPPLDRRITPLEYDAVYSWARLLGLREGFAQELASASGDYIPAFDLAQP